MIGIDLFAGAGGMTLGAKQAGIRVVYAVENDPHASATYAGNHPEVTLHADDICKLTSIKIDRNGEEVVVFGGPPCQGFSTSNQRTRTLTNPRNWMFQEFRRIVDIVRPDWVVFENVKGITETEKGFFLNTVIAEFEHRGYTVSSWVLNAADFGVPQRRQRLFVVCSLAGHKIEKPKATYRKHTAVRYALADLPKLSNGATTEILAYRCKARSGYAKDLRGQQCEASGHLVSRNAPFVVERYIHIPQGGNWQNIPESLMKNYKDRTQCHTGIYHRLDPDKPSIVIGNYRKNMLIHPYENRGLSVREAARIQSFPDSYIFQGSIGFQQQQVGNAVPPMLARAIFSIIVNTANSLP